jgi:hypothetical protein
MHRSVFNMKKNFVLSLGFLAALGTTSAWSQNIKSIEFRNGKQLDMGAISELAITFDANGSANWCGLTVRWGDGQEQTLRIGDDQYKSSPAIVPHTFTRAGSYRIDVEGRPMIRGLRSAAACDGRPAPIDVTVVDKAAQAEAQRQQAEKARQEAERRQQAEMERQRAEQARMEDERRQREFAEKELELKRRELQMKEEMLKREEELRRRQPAAAPAPAAAPRPAPAAAPSAPAAPRPAPAAVKPADGF